jgi:Family of unknown function (DUF6152)
MSQWRLLAASALFAGAAFAHHQFSSEYDQNKPMTLTGTIQNVQWNDPHVHFTLDVKNQSGKQEMWTLETAKPEYLKDHGVPRSMFKKGERITVNAYAATKNADVASARMITFADGKTMQVADPSEDGGPAK